MDSKQLIDFIESKRKEHKYNISVFATMCGLARSHYYGLLKGETGCSFNTMIKMLNAIGYTLNIADADKEIALQPMPKKRNKAKKHKKRKITILID